MSAFETPDGLVKVYPPSKAGGYYRVEWYEHCRRHQSTGGRTIDAAKMKAAAIVSRLQAGTEPLGRTRLEDALDAYLIWGALQWSTNHLVVTRREMTKVRERYGRIRCDQVDARLLRSLCNAMPTASGAKAQRSRLRAFLVWAHGQGYLTPAQKELLDSYTWVPSSAPVQRPARQSKKSSIEIRPDEVPSHDQVTVLGDALQARLRYGKLLVELAASSGLRIGELLALRADHVLLGTRRLHIREQVLGVRNADDTRLAPPKMGRTRVSIFPELATTGYDLGAALAARLKEVAAERKAGTNPDALLFPAKRGGYWWPTAFTNDEFSPAAKAAQWPALTWQENGQERRQWIFTMHSLRHRFASDAIERWALTPAELTEVGGWESILVVFTKYYGRSADLLERVYAKTAAQVE